MNLLIAALFSILIIILVFLIVAPLIDGANDAKNQFLSKTKMGLADIYLFIDIEKLLVISLSMIFLCSLIVYLLTQSIVLVVLLAIFTALLPGIMLKVLKRKRVTEFTNQLPDFLLSVSSSMSVGMGLNQSLEISSREEGGPMQQEFDLFLSELRLGVSFDDSLDNLNERIGTLEIQLVVAAMKISREVGGNLSDVLRRLADTLRTKIEMEGKVNTLTAQGRAQGIVMLLLPIVIGIALLFLDSTSEYMMHIFTKWYGWLTLIFIAVMLSIGYFFIRKIVNIDV
ncbi:MAG: tight adherence protein B [Arenicella sp.]|jgi:tight adherence protein B